MTDKWLTGAHAVKLPSNPPEPNEQGEQRAVIAWAKMAQGKYPDLELLHHIANERSNKYQRFNQAKLGVKAGIPDLHLPSPRGGWHGLYIELKTQDGRVRPEQKQVMEQLHQQGYAVQLCRSAEEAIHVLEVYLSYPKTQIVWEKNELADGI